MFEAVFSSAFQMPPYPEAWFTVVGVKENTPITAPIPQQENAVTA